MAYRRSNGKGRKIEPAVKTLIFSTPVVSAGASDEFYIDLSQSASLINRRFYRQGINWAVNSMKVLTSAFIGGIQVQKLPETWVMSNAWMKGFKAWQRMNNEALEENESVRPRFLDFKIFADAQHHTVGYGANLLPSTFTQLPGAPLVAVVATPGEWEASSFRIPDTTVLGNTRDREIVAVGPSYPGNGASGKNAVSLIEGYASSRALPAVLDPNVPDDMSDADGVAPQNWITAVFNEGTEQSDEVLTDMRTENNIAPYPFENDGVNADTMYPGGANQLDGLAVHDFDFITSTTVGGQTRLNGGLFPCGLIKICAQNSGSVSSNLVIQLDLVPGTHRGYLCEPMTEM